MRNQMRSLVAIVVMLNVGVLSSCAKRPSPTSDEITVSRVVVGTKTPDYEVVAPNQLRLARGVKFEVVEGPGGKKDNAIVILKENGASGGYMACGCVGAQTSSCVTVSDNPTNAACSGSCTDSEGKSHPCELFGPLIGPPKNPGSVKFVDQPVAQPSP